MKYNSETKKVLEDAGLAWIIPLIHGKCREFFVKLIDLDSLNLGPEGHFWDSGYYWTDSRLFLFDSNGNQLTEVGGKRMVPKDSWEFLWRWPFFKKVQVPEETSVYETVEEALKRLGDEVANSVRFIVNIHWAGKVTVYKLRKSDKDLRSRLREKADEAVNEIRALLED